MRHFPALQSQGGHPNHFFPGAPIPYSPSRSLQITSTKNMKTKKHATVLWPLALSPGFATLCTLEKVLAHGEPLQLFAEVKAGSG
jgi:hypothetical protein